MKKILAFIVCIVLVCAMPLMVFAEETTEEIPETVPVVEETIPETDVPDVAPTPSTDLTPEEEAKGYADIIAAWFEKNSGALGIVFTIIGYGIVLFKKVKTMTASVTTMNNNAVSISENGSLIANTALNQVKDIAEVVRGYSDKMSELLARVEKSEEDKQKLEEALKEAHALLKASKLANKALAAEVAKLITLANLPNSVKDDMYSDFLNNVRAVLEAEYAEVKEDDREEA